MLTKMSFETNFSLTGQCSLSKDRHYYQWKMAAFPNFEAIPSIQCDINGLEEIKVNAVMLIVHLSSKFI